MLGEVFAGMLLFMAFQPSGRDVELCWQSLSCKPFTSFRRVGLRLG